MSLSSLAYALSIPEVMASYKVQPEDFQVREILNFEPEGEGDHLFLLVKKKNMTTHEVQQRLMRHFALPDRDVSFSGMKDKQALTWQWFSIKPGKNSDLKQATLASELNNEYMQVQRVQKNSRKLKRGSHRSNQFFLRLRDLNAHPEELSERIQMITQQGVPNYFGEQRFGFQGENINRAKQLFSGESRLQKRYQRNIYVSAARAFLFNLVLSERVRAGSWSRYLPGDVMMLDGSSACFKPEDWDHVLEERLNAFDIHPTGPLWGEGDKQTDTDCAAMELDIANKEHELKCGLEKIKAQPARRALRSMPRNLETRIENENTIVLEFTLDKGAYATSLLRELVRLKPVNAGAGGSPGACSHE